MEREYKFKAYHKEQKKMYFFDVMWGNHNTGGGYIGMIPFGEELDYGAWGLILWFIGWTIYAINKS